MHVPYHPPTGHCNGENEPTEASISSPYCLLSSFLVLAHSPANAKRQGDWQEQNRSRSQQSFDWPRLYEYRQLMFTELKCN